MAEDSVAESGAAQAEAAAEARLDVPAQELEPDAAADAAVPAPEPMVPSDMPAVLATPIKVDVFSVGASAIGHLLVGLLIVASLASAQKPPDIIPVKLIPADQVPKKLQELPKPPEDQKKQTAQTEEQQKQRSAPPESKAPNAPAKDPAKDPSGADRTPPPSGKDPAAATKAENKSWRDIAASLGLADYGRKTTLPDTLLQELTAQTKRCWAVPSGWSDPQQVTVTLRFQLKPDGTLDGDPAVVEFPATPIGAASAKSAIAAVTQCGPYRLPADRYEQWKDIQLNMAP